MFSSVFLSVALFLQAVIDTLIEVSEEKDVDENNLKEKIEAAADFLVNVGAGQSPEFTKLSKAWATYGFGNAGHKRFLRYEHMDVFSRFVKDKKFTGEQLVIMRNMLLSIIDDKTSKKQTAIVVSACIDFLCSLESYYLDACDNYVSRIPQGIRDLCVRK